MSERAVVAGQAGAVSFDLAEPALEFGLGDAGNEVVADGYEYMAS
ncbi:hypothetical protein ACSHXN_01555 [Streptomyces sp. HUAS TT11]